MVLQYLRESVTTSLLAALIRLSSRPARVRPISVALCPNTSANDLRFSSADHTLSVPHFGPRATQSVDEPRPPTSPPIFTTKCPRVCYLLIFGQAFIDIYQHMPPSSSKSCMNARRSKVEPQVLLSNHLHFL